MALTPGGVDQDLFRIDYKRIKRPMFPLDNFNEKPDLCLKFVDIYWKNWNSILINQLITVFMSSSNLVTSLSSVPL